MSFFLEPIEPIRLSQPVDPVVPQLTVQLGLLVVQTVLLEQENAQLKRENGDLMEMFVPPWRG